MAKPSSNSIPKIVPPRSATRPDSMRINVDTRRLFLDVAELARRPATLPATRYVE